MVTINRTHNYSRQCGQGFTGPGGTKGTAVYDAASSLCRIQQLHCRPIWCRKRIQDKKCTSDVQVSNASRTVCIR